MKFVYKSILVMAVAMFSVIAANAQGVIDGYFRVSNAKTDKYVEVTGPFSADPTADFNDAQYKAGTVIYVHAEQPETENVYKVTSLRSQGIEVVGDYLADYEQALYDVIFTEQGFNSSEEALWNVVKGGFQYGYTSIGRAAIQMMIVIVAERLDEEGLSDKERKELYEFAKRFNTEVAQYIDLGIRLEPVEGQENTFRLYYETPDLEVVSNWYLDDANRETFEKGFAAMRQYLNGKIGVTGEGLEPYEIKEMQSWGYDPEVKYGNLKNDEGVIVLTYEQIFADHELLFNWLKLNVIKFTDPERCPDIELRGLRLRSFAEEMQKHRLTKQIIDYLPRLQTHQRIYLCDGKNDVYGHFDFTSQDGADALGESAQWVMHAIDNETQQFFVKNMKEFKGKYFSAVYYDFPVSAVTESTSVNQLTTETKNDKGYAFVKLVPQQEIGRQIALIVASDADNTQLNVADGKAFITPIVPPVSGMGVSSVEADKQYSPRRAEENVDVVSTEHFTGVLLSTKLTAQDLKNYREIYLDQTPVYVFKGSETIEALNNTYLVFGNGIEGQSLGPNQAIYTPYDLDATEDYVIINRDIDIFVGKTDTGEEETDGKDEAEHIKIAQAFDGKSANTFENLVTFSQELEYNKDFTVTVTVPETVDTDNWKTPNMQAESLSKAYEEAFADYPELYEEYVKLFETEAETLVDDFVDGFYLSSHLDRDQTAVLEQPSVSEEDGVIGYQYNLSFNAPCSGIYEVTVAPAENSSVDFTTAIHKVKIYPNLYAKFGPGEEPGFNINEHKFVVEGDKYYIDLEQNYDLSKCVGYTPGTYFSSSLTASVPGETVENKPRRVSGITPDGKYAVQLPNLSSIANTDTPLTMTVTKNGVTASYDFYVRTNLPTGIEGIDASESGVAVYYNLQGVKVDSPEAGNVYIKVEDGKAVKVVY